MVFEYQDVSLFICLTASFPFLIPTCYRMYKSNNSKGLFF